MRTCSFEKLRSTYDSFGVRLKSERIWGARGKFWSLVFSISLGGVKMFTADIGHAQPYSKYIWPTRNSPFVNRFAYSLCFFFFSFCSGSVVYCAFTWRFHQSVMREWFMSLANTERARKRESVCVLKKGIKNGCPKQQLLHSDKHNWNGSSCNQV